MNLPALLCFLQRHMREDNEGQVMINFAEPHPYHAWQDHISMNIRRTILALIALLILPAAALARPVSYADGSMVMLSSDADRTASAYLYSPSARWALGPLLELTHDDESLFGGLQVNHLLRRWNNPDSQGNLFLLSALGGHGIEQGGDRRIGGYVGMEADWENRRYYTRYEPRYRFGNAEEGDFFQHMGRLGIAPYIKEAGALHTWVMVQIDHEPERDDPWRITPLVRLFQGPVLAEAGISLDGDALLTLDITF